MLDLQAFEGEFGTLRTITEEGKTFFVANDVAKMLGYARPADAVAAHCKGSVKRRVPTNGGEQEVKVIPEGDVYRLITHSKLPAAEKFERWVFDEVLPAIRLHGAYMTPETIEKVLYNPDFMIRLAKKLKEAQEKVKELTPKGEFYDAVANSDTLFSMADVAKTLDMGIGRNRLFALLRETGILQPDNMPYQRYVDRGYFKVVEGKYGVNNNVVVSKTTYVKQKGIDFIRRVLHGTDA